MKKVFLLVLVSIVSFSTIAQKKRDDVEVSVPAITVHYALPKVVFKVDIEMQETIEVPGKYAKYAKKYLGISPEITERKSEWTLKNVSVHPESVPDNNRVYSFTSSNPDGTLQISLTREGLLAGVGNAAVVPTVLTDGISFEQKNEKNIEEKDFTDIKTYNFLDYRVDSVFYEEKGPKNVVTRHFDPNSPGHYFIKDEEQIVKELVARIYDIRTDRYDILRGDLDLSDNVSLKDLIDNYDEMDRSYMELFMGKTESKEHKATFYVEPVDGKSSQLLFRFSKSKGLSDSKDVTSQSYVLSYYSIIKPVKSPVIVTNNELAYIEPAYVQASLKVNDKALSSFKVVVPQWGVINKIGGVSLEKMNYTFYPEYGSLKSAVYK